MKKSQSKKHLTLRCLSTQIKPSFFQAFFLPDISFYLILFNVATVFHFIIILSNPKGLNIDKVIPFILLFLVFLLDMILLFKAKNLKSFSDFKILGIMTIFFMIHFYVLLFIIEAQFCSFLLLNSLILVQYSLKALKSPGYKLMLILPIFIILSLKFELFVFAEIPEIILFICTMSMVMFRFWLKHRKIKKKLSKSQNDTDESKSPQINILASIQEAVILFDSDLKMLYQNQFLNKLIENSVILTQIELESAVLALKQDEKYMQMKGMSIRSEEEFFQLIKAFKSKMAIFSNSVSELNDESYNGTSFSKKTLKSMKSVRKNMRPSKEIWKSKVESLMEKSKIKEITSGVEKTKLKNHTFMNNNGHFFKKSKEPKIPVPKSLREVLKDFFSNKDPRIIDRYHFYAKSYEINRILLINFTFIEGRILVLIKSLDKKDPILSVWDNYITQNKLLASMCHELRTPLNSITNMLELMEGSDEDNESLFPNSPNNPHKEYLTTAILNSKLLLSSINDFLDYFSISSNIFETKMTHFNIKSLLLECDSIFHVFSLKKGINFFIHIPDLCSYNCYNDENRIKQIIMNLLNNAFKYTNFGGTITLGLKSKADVFEVIVRDTGIGMETGHLKTLANFQASMANSLFQMLGGFGLSISNHLANYIGPYEEVIGKIYKGIKVKTEKDKGSRFSFLIEKNSKEDDEGFAITDSRLLDVRKTIENFNLSHKRSFHFITEPIEKTSEFNTEMRTCECRKVLAIDDNEFNLFVLIEQFKKQDIIIDTANNGMEAISLIEESLIESSGKFCPVCKFYKLILMDIDMPEKNGYETTKEIKEIIEGKTFDVNIVALSAFSEAETKEKALEAGIVDYLEKPFSQKKLDYLIHKYIHE